MSEKYKDIKHKYEPLVESVPLELVAKRLGAPLEELLELSNLIVSTRKAFIRSSDGTEQLIGLDQPETPLQPKD